MQEVIGSTLEGWNDGNLDKKDKLLVALDLFRVNSNFIAGHQRLLLGPRPQFVGHCANRGLQSIMLSQLTAFHCQGYLNQFDEAVSTIIMNASICL